jgi:hypothetical protein
MKIHEKIKCKSCQIEFELIYNHRDGLPVSCPFCWSEDQLQVIEEINDNKMNANNLREGNRDNVDELKEKFTKN